MIKKSEFIIKVIETLQKQNAFIISTKNLPVEVLNVIHDTFQYDYIYDPIKKMRIKITDVKGR